jgi:hypothetical protein
VKEEAAWEIHVPRRAAPMLVEIDASQLGIPQLSPRELVSVSWITRTD